MSKSCNLNYYRLKPNLFFIEEKILFLILEDNNLKDIKKLLERFFSQYFIFILILNHKEYRKLIESKEVGLLDNLKILNFKDFFNLTHGKIFIRFRIELATLNCGT